jgi:hypothetical protein
MRNIIETLSLACILALGCSGAYAQVVVAPPGSSDKTLGDNDIKSRSVELERIKRDAGKTDPGTQSQQMPKEKFEEIKADFENIQRLQNGIIRAYTMSKQINYAKISADAGQMNKSSVRLESNLFPIADKKDKKRSKEQKPDADEPLPQDIKGLIVTLDDTLSGFVGNPMFTNPKVVNSADNAKAHMELEKIIKLSAALNQEAGKVLQR